MWVCVALLLGLGGAGCADSPGEIPGAEAPDAGDDLDLDTATPDGEGPTDRALAPLVEMDSASEYVLGLCRLDPVAYLEDDDPLTAIAAAIEELPARSVEEQAEVAFLVSSLTVAADAENIVESLEMQQVVNVVQARCN